MSFVVNCGLNYGGFISAYFQIGDQPRIQVIQPCMRRLSIESVVYVKDQILLLGKVLGLILI